MCGNVWELTSSIKGTYPSSAQYNPTGPSSGSVHTMRGGSYTDGQLNSRIAVRFGESKNGEVGFRLVSGSAPSGGSVSSSYSSGGTSASQIAARIGSNMVYVSGGSFQMGQTSDQWDESLGTTYDDEKPVHKVTLSSFYLCKYEVTQAEWRAVMGNNPSEIKGDNFPVTNITYSDALTFISRLNAASNYTFRLPTEAEWEFAARGGTQSRGYKYSGSNDLNSVAWNSRNAGQTLHTVGTKQPNELGIYDMSGNAWEMTADHFGTYPSSAQYNPRDNASGNRVARGGSFNDGLLNSRNAVRFNFNNNRMGLRLAR